MAEKKSGLSAAAKKRQSPPMKSMSKMKRTVSKPVPLGGVKKPSVPAKNTGGAMKKAATKGMALNPTKTKGWARGRKTI